MDGVAGGDSLDRFGEVFRTELLAAGVRDGPDPVADGFPLFSPAAVAARISTAIASYACAVNTSGAVSYSSSYALVKNSAPGPPADGAVPMTLFMSLSTSPGRSESMRPSGTMMSSSGTSLAKPE